MTKLRVHNFSMSADGYCAGPDQSLGDPLGVGGESLHEWMFKTPSGRRMMGRDVPDDEPGGVDDEIWRRGIEGIGATIMGRNMFGPVRGEWPDETWTGWWGDEPPYHHPVFVLTHHGRRPLEMQGGHHVPLRHRRDRGRAGAGDRRRRTGWTSGSAAVSRRCSST